VDTAQSSGWSIWVQGKPVACGHVDMLAGVDNGLSQCRDAISEAKAHDLPAILVFERPFRGNTQGQFIGCWKQKWIGAGGVKSRMTGVYPMTWRAAVLGKRWARAERDKVRAEEQRWARALAKANGLDPAIAGHGDAAPGLGIGAWASYAGEVAAKLPVKARAV
jgi:hypothetical protein